MASEDAMDVEAAGAPLAGMEVESSTEPVRSAASPESAGVVVVHEARQMVVAFLKEHLADEVSPDNSCVVIIDAELSLRCGFKCLLDHDIRAAPVLSKHEQTFIGLLTVTDLIRALREPFTTDLSARLGSQTVRQWLAAMPRELLICDAEQTLLSACLTMRDCRVHRMPVIYRKRKLLYTLEHWHVLEFVHRHLIDRDDPRSKLLFNFTLAQLCIGTYAGLKTVSEGAPLKEVLDLLLTEELPAVPIVDSEGKLRDVYSRTDVTALLVGKISAATLDVPVGDALTPIRPRGFRLATCRTMDTLGTVFNIFDRSHKQRLYVINEHGVIEGVLSLRDLLVYFLHGV